LKRRRLMIMALLLSVSGKRERNRAFSIRAQGLAVTGESVVPPELKRVFLFSSGRDSTARAWHAAIRRKDYFTEPEWDGEPVDPP
jgi:hypothetical protein